MPFSTRPRSPPLHGPQPSHVRSSDEETRSGYILWLPAKDHIPETSIIHKAATSSTSLHIDGFNHPVVIVALYHEVAIIQTLTSFGGQDLLTRHPISPKVRKQHLPIFPTIAHPDGLPRLRLSGDVSLLKDGYVKISNCYLIEACYLRPYLGPRGSVYRMTERSVSHLRNYTPMFNETLLRLKGPLHSASGPKRPKSGGASQLTFLYTAVKSLIRSCHLPSRFRFRFLLPTSWNTNRPPLQSQRRFYRSTRSVEKLGIVHSLLRGILNLLLVLCQLIIFLVRNAGFSFLWLVSWASGMKTGSRGLRRQGSLLYLGKPPPKGAQTFRRSTLTSDKSLRSKRYFMAVGHGRYYMYRQIDWKDVVSWTLIVCMVAGISYLIWWIAATVRGAFNLVRLE